MISDCKESLIVKMVSASDLYGGAGIAAYRLLKGMGEIGVKAELLVQDKRSRHKDISGPPFWLCGMTKLLPYIDPVPKLPYTMRHRGAWSCNLLPNPFFSHRWLQDSDVAHLHWVGGGMVPIREISKIKKPIVWTLHDAWPFTGGCHIPYECTRFREKCGNCPQLRSGRDNDLSRYVWECKSKNWRDLQMTFVAPSRWLASLAASSGLFKDFPVEVIPNGLDLDVFAPIEKSKARSSLKLPQKARILLFSAFAGVANWNKGGDLLQEAIHILLRQNQSHEMILLITGAKKAPSENYFPIPVVNLGVINDDAKKGLIYSAADVTVIPSRSESLGYVAMESMSCETPCVSFAIGGLLDLISHRENGYLAEPLSVEDFSRGIQWIFEDPVRQKRLRIKARQDISNKYSYLAIAHRYRLVYEDILRKFR